MRVPFLPWRRLSRHSGLTAMTVPPCIVSLAAAQASRPAWPVPSTHTVPPERGARLRVCDAAP